MHVLIIHSSPRLVTECNEFVLLQPELLYLSQQKNCRLLSALIKDSCYGFDMCTENILNFL